MLKTEVATERKSDFPKLMQHETGTVVLATGPTTGMCVHSDDDISVVGMYSQSWEFDGADWEDFIGLVTIYSEDF